MKDHDTSQEARNNRSLTSLLIRHAGEGHSTSRTEKRKMPRPQPAQAKAARDPQMPRGDLVVELNVVGIKMVTLNAIGN